MCIQIINRFHGCAHNGNNTPLLKYVDRSSCRARGNCGEPLRTEVKWFDGPCFGCRELRAPEGDKIVGWFKHCIFSIRCNHEHSHCEVVGLERYESEEDFILETPSNELCPECADTGEVSNQPSRVPRGYQGRSHVSMNEFASSRAGGVSMASVTPRAPRATPVGYSRMPDSLDESDESPSPPRV